MNRPTLAPHFYKAHGLGNDYLVFSAGEGWTAGEDAVARVCDRWTGAGSDGIVCHLGVEDGTHRLRMFNPDGSEFERSGNGLRVLAAWLGARGREELGVPFRVTVGGDTVEMEILGRDDRGGFDVRVEMGEARVGPEEVGADTRRMDRGGIRHLDLGRVTPTLVSVGNPHAVSFLERIEADQGSRLPPELVEDAALFRVLGPFLTDHPAFPRGINVQVARVIGDRRIHARVWERGVGETSASGTSACAVAVAAVHEGRTAPGEIEVRMEGGVLRVDVSPELDVRLRGPVEEVCEGRLTDGFLAALAAGEAASTEPVERTEPTEPTEATEATEPTGPAP